MRLYSAKETAEILNISYYTLLNMRKQGKGPKATLVGCLIKYSPQHIKEYLDAQAKKRNSWQRRPSGQRRAIALQLAETYGWTCSICKMPIDPRAVRYADKLSVDHVLPVSKGGSDDLDNMRPAHHGCNAGKRDRIRKPIANPVDNLSRWITEN